VTNAAAADGLALPADALVVLVGVSGSGKSSWAARRFPPRVILSSDAGLMVRQQDQLVSRVEFPEVLPHSSGADSVAAGQ
jgi:hypothetical protein